MLMDCLWFQGREGCAGQRRLLRCWPVSTQPLPAISPRCMPIAPYTAICPWNFLLKMQKVGESPLKKDDFLSRNRP